MSDLCYTHADVVRGLTFDTDDINSSQVHRSVHAPEAAGSCAASASTRRFQRSVSFSDHPQVHELKESSQDAKVEEGQSNEGQVPFNESSLPDGITAIAVPDPNDPSIIVMQVGNTLNMCSSGLVWFARTQQQTFANCILVFRCTAYRLLCMSVCLSVCLSACMMKELQARAGLHSCSCRSSAA